MGAARRIVHIVSTMDMGGVQRLVLGLASTPALAADEQIILCLGAMSGDLLEEARRTHVVDECPFVWPASLPVPSYRLLKVMRSVGLYTLPVRIAAKLRELRADIVHTHLSEHIELQAAGAALAGLPIVWTIHGLYEPAGRVRSEWRLANLAGAWRGIQVTADSTPIVDDYVARAIGTRDAITVVHAGADVSAFTAERERVLGWRKAHGIPETAVVFGTAGRLSRVKGHDVLIEATELLAREHADVHVAIAGTGAWTEFLTDETKRRGLDGRIHLLGFQADVPAFVRELDVFVLPSRSEGFPLALIEALAAGRPCIATSVGGVEEMFGAEGGLVVKRDDPQALASAMKRMLFGDTRMAFSARGPAIAANYSYDRCGRELDAIYRRLLGR
jgi:glycosyltransferase involved in cell wall biosynthesis